jgi:hypothetical protein
MSSKLYFHNFSLNNQIDKISCLNQKKCKFLQNINYILIQKQDDIVNLHTNVCFYFSQKK